MAEKETHMADRREFVDPEGNRTYYISAPTADDIRGADWQYSKMYTKSLVEGITTASEMMDILMRRGVIGPEFEQRQAELTEELSKKVITLQSAIDIDEKHVLAMEVANARQELFNWNQRLNGPMSNTCEQIADDARLEHLTSRIVENKDGSKVWEGPEDFMREKNQALALRARFEVMLYLQGLESDFLEQTPEAVALKEIEEDVRKQADEALAKLEADRVKLAEEKKAEEAPKTRKKRTTKKKSSE